MRWEGRRGAIRTIVLLALAWIAPAVAWCYCLNMTGPYTFPGNTSLAVAMACPPSCQPLEGWWWSPRCAGLTCGIQGWAA